MRSLDQIVSGYLDFAERQAEREEIMTMQDWAEHLDKILTMSVQQKPYIRYTKKRKNVQYRKKFLFYGDSAFFLDTSY